MNRTQLRGIDGGASAEEPAARAPVVVSVDYQSTDVRSKRKFVANIRHALEACGLDGSFAVKVWNRMQLRGSRVYPVGYEGDTGLKISVPCDGIAFDATLAVPAPYRPSEVFDLLKRAARHPLHPSGYAGDTTNPLPDLRQRPRIVRVKKEEALSHADALERLAELLREPAVTQKLHDAQAKQEELPGMIEALQRQHRATLNEIQRIEREVRKLDTLRAHAAGMEKDLERYTSELAAARTVLGAPEAARLLELLESFKGT